MPNLAIFLRIHQLFSTKTAVHSNSSERLLFRQLQTTCKSVDARSHAIIHRTLFPHENKANASGQNLIWSFEPVMCSCERQGSFRPWTVYPGFPPRTVCPLHYETNELQQNNKKNIQYKIHLFFPESTSSDVQKGVKVFFFISLCCPSVLLLSTSSD